MEFSEVIEVLDRGSSIDVQSTCTFESLMIKAQTLERLKTNQFDRPSPVQAKAIPIGLLGRDMLVQAKSGTGKTLVFSVLAVENVDPRERFIQKIIVTPTREISVQIKETVRKVAPPGTRTSVYVGGSGHKLNELDLKNNRPHIVIGTPGRLAQLLKLGVMDMSHVDFFVLDEADKLMDDIFTDDINYVINALPPQRQVCVFSATYPRNLDTLLSTFLRDAALVRFNADDVQLIGIKQYVVPKCSPMLEKLTQVLKSIRYVQALVFCDTIAKCSPIASHLKSQGLDVTFVSSAMSQKDRQLAVDQLRTKRVKILVSSDLTARGIDADHVNLVVNVDAAANEETYFHRIGRAARFGAHGAAVTLLEDEKALKCFTALAYRGRVTCKRVKDVDSLPDDLVKNQEFWGNLPLFIDFEKDKKGPKAPNDLSKVPNRDEAVKALEQERGKPSTWKYDRDTMMTMRSVTSSEPQEKSPEKSESPDIVEQIGDIQIDEKENVAEEKEEQLVPKTFKERLAEAKAAREQAKKEAAETKTDEKPVENKTKFKFVPTREKAKKKYYMRGELQHIRDAFTSDEWRAYAKSKFDFSQEPFLDAYGPSSAPEIEKPTENSSGDVVADKKSSKKAQKSLKISSESTSKTIRYSRFELKKIQQDVPKQQWIPYIKSKWDTTEEPWELDPWMRCSFEERLRRIRKREKDERKKVIEERKKKREEDRSELVSSGKYTGTVEIKETSWKSYTERMKADFKEKMEKWKREEAEGKEPELRRIGPVVPERSPPLIYRYRVDLYKRRLDEQDAFLMQETKLTDGKIKEAEIQTDDVEKEDVVERKETKEMESQTDVATKSEDVETPEDEEYDDEEYWDEEEEEYWDEEKESEDVAAPAPQNPLETPEFQRIQQEHMDQLGSQYIRNIQFQAAHQSYLDMMNAFYRNVRREE